MPWICIKVNFSRWVNSQCQNQIRWPSCLAWASISSIRNAPALLIVRKTVLSKTIFIHGCIFIVHANCLISQFDYGWLMENQCSQFLEDFFGSETQYACCNDTEKQYTVTIQLQGIQCPDILRLVCTTNSVTSKNTYLNIFQLWF